jgi:hypothetical protein
MDTSPQQRKHKEARYSKCLQILFITFTSSLGSSQTQFHATRRDATNAYKTSFTQHTLSVTTAFIPIFFLNPLHQAMKSMKKHTKCTGGPAKIVPPRWPKPARNDHVPRCAMQTQPKDQPHL